MTHESNEAARNTSSYSTGRRIAIQLVAGIKPGRASSEEIIIFDSTGMALQDVVSAAAVYEKAINAGLGAFVNLAE